MDQPFSHATRLTLRRSNRVLTNFDRYTVKLDMLDLGNPFTFSLWYSAKAESEWATMVRDVRLGGEITFHIDDRLVYTGRIETLAIRVNRKSGACIAISGRDLSGTAISWDADPRINKRNETLNDVLTAAFAPLGVPIIMGEGIGGTREGQRGAAAHWTPRTQMVDHAKVKPGEKVMDFALRIIKKLGYMAWVSPMPDGTLGLLIDTPRYDQTPVFNFKRHISDRVVTPDSDILDSDYHAQIRSVPTVVTAYGTAPRGDRLPTRHRVQAEPSGLPDFVRYNSATGELNGNRNVTETVNGATISVRENRTTIFEVDDPRSSTAHIFEAPSAAPSAAERPRATVARIPFTNDELMRYPFVEKPLPSQPVHLHSKRARTAAHGEQEARRTIAHAMKDFRGLDITVKGHGQLVDGARKLFTTNVIAHLRDDLVDIDEDFLVTGVEFEGGRGSGQETKLTLGTKNAITLLPEPQ